MGIYRGVDNSDGSFDIVIGADVSSDTEATMLEEMSPECVTGKSGRLIAGRNP